MTEAEPQPVPLRRRVLDHLVYTAEEREKIAKDPESRENIGYWRWKDIVRTTTTYLISGTVVVLACSAGSKIGDLFPPDTTPVASGVARAYNRATASCEPGENRLVKHPDNKHFYACVDGKEHVFTVRPRVNSPLIYEEAPAER